MSRRLLVALGALTLAACAGFEPRAPEMPSAPADPAVVAPVLPPDPLRDEEARALEAACRKSARAKSAPAACACVARNHRERLTAPELQLLTAKYRAGARAPRARHADEARLYEYDAGVAAECVRDPAYIVPEEP